MTPSNVHQGIAALNPYKPGKPVEELARELGLDDIIKLASNENPRGPSPSVAAAVQAACGELTRYPDGSGYLLKTALAQHIGVDAAQITLGNGSNDVLDLVARVTVEPGSQVVTAQHSFVVYRLATVSAGGELIEVPAKDYGADLGAMLDAVGPKTRTVFIANPNNPTGTWLASTPLKQFLQSVPENVWVVVDEAYFEYVADPEYPNCTQWLAEFPNLIVTRTFSKAYGLAAVRLGYAVSSSTMADLMNRARQPFNCSSLALAAGVAALEDQGYVQESVALNNAGMQQLLAGFAQLGLASIPSLGNFVCVDCGRPGAQVFEAMLQKGVIVRPVAEYGLPDHVRISVGLEAENARCLEALTAVLA